MARRDEEPVRTIEDLYQNARDNKDFESIEQGIIDHPEWLTQIPEERKWGIIHQIVFHGNVKQLDRLLVLQTQNTNFRLLSETKDNKTVLSISEEKKQTNRAMHQRIERLVMMDDLLSDAKNAKWEACESTLTKMPDIINEKPPYRNYYFIHHLAYIGDQNKFDDYNRRYKFDLNVLTNSNKSIVDIANERKHRNFAQYLNTLKESSSSRETSDRFSRESSTSTYYKVQRDDTLTKIAEEGKFTLDQMKAANPELKDYDRLTPGQVIKLPLVQQLIDSKLEEVPSVSKDNVTVFQHFVETDAKPSLIPECASNQNLSDVKEKLKAVFVANDVDNDGFMSLKDFSAFLINLNLRMNDQDVNALFKEINKQYNDKITFQEFFNYYEEMINGKKTKPTQSEADLLSAFLKADKEGKCALGGISQFINKRWEKFNNFKRDGKEGKLVMVGGEEAKDVLPGEYSLVDLITWSDITPQGTIPNLVKIPNVHWTKSSNPKSESGRLLFPYEFADMRLPVDIGTNDKLAYYGCCLANESQMKVSLLHRHAIQDFTYYDNYYNDFVKGRAGLERHEFAHLDCPFQEDNGYFILGKFSDQNENELHLTAFKIPLKHTLYVPPLTIHSNDYLKGTWRTMLSDATSIDHVTLERERYDKGKDQISFDFKK